jgi:hypothetical protein
VEPKWGLRSSHIGAVVGALGLHALALALTWPLRLEKVGAKLAPGNDALYAVLLPQEGGHAPKTVLETRQDAPKKPPNAHAETARAALDVRDAKSYRESSAVDQIAVPVGEWGINTSLLPVGSPCKFIITIWISARGKLDKWEVQSDAISEELIEAVFRQFDDTVMNPALIGAIPVASVQRLELVVERQ